MSVKQSRNVDSSSDVSDAEMEPCYSEDVKTRVTRFNQHANEIAQQIDELITAGCEVIERLRRRFVARMENVKEELVNGVESQNSQWEESSKKSRDDLERLISIQELVKSLGISS